MRRAASVLGAATLLSLASCSSTPAPNDVARQHVSSRPTVRSSAAEPHPSASPASSPRAMRIRVTQAPWRLPQAVSRGVAIAAPGGAVLAGGLLPGDVSTARAYRLSLPSGHVTRLASLGTATHDAAGALLQGQPAVFGGGSSSELSMVQRLGADGHWHLVGRLPEARSDLSAIAYGGGVVVVGGYDGSRSPRTILHTDDGRHLAVLGRMPAGLRYAAVAVMGHTAWVIGGEEDHQELTGVYAVDLRSGRARPDGRLPHGLGHASAVVVGDRVLVLGGRTTPDRPTDAIWWFTPSTDSWHRVGHLPYPVADAPTVVTANGAYLLGGETPSFTDRVTEVTWR